MKTRLKKPLSDFFQMRDSKYRLFLAINNTYQAYIRKGLKKHAEALQAVFKIDFSKEKAVGFFIAQSTQVINKALEILAPLCNSKVDPDLILPKELSALIFSNDNNKYVKACLPQILVNTQQSFKMTEADNPDVAQLDTDFTMTNYTQSLKILDKNIETFNSSLNKEINDDIIFSLKKEITLSSDEEKLIGSFLEVLLKHINEEMEILRNECLSVIFLVNYINFDDIKNSIKSSLGLAEKHDAMLLLKSYMNALLNNIRLRAKTADKNELTELNIEKMVSEFTNLIKTASLKQKVEALKQEYITIETQIADDNRKQVLQTILSQFCKIESTLFQEMNQNVFDGYFYKLNENLNSNQRNHAYDEIYDLLLNSSITADNALLTKLIQKHASLLFKQREVTARDNIVFDMDDIQDSNTQAMSAEIEEIPDHDVSEHLSNTFSLYKKLLSGEHVAETEFSPPTYNDQKLDMPKPHDGVNINQVELSEQQEQASETRSEAPIIPTEPKQTTAKSIRSIAATQPVQKTEHEISKSPEDFQTREAEAKQRVIEARLKLEIAEFEQANLTLDRKVKQLDAKNTELNIENTELNKVNTNVTKENSSLKSANHQLAEEKLALEAKMKVLQENNSALDTDNLKLNAANLKLKEWKNAHKDDLNNLKISNNQLFTKEIVRNFDLFYKDYRDNASKGFLGIFASHGNTGREVAKKFHTAFYNKMDSLVLNYTLPINVVINQVKTAFKQLIDEQELLLSSSRHRAHSFRTYLLAYHDYLDAFVTNNPDKTHGDIVKKNHADVYVADKTIDRENQYKNTFPIKAHPVNNMQQRLQYGKQ